MAEEEIFKCQKCPYSSSLANIKNHFISHHLKVRENKCDECKSTFARKSSLTQHKRAIHLKIKDNKCEECDAAFTQKRHLQRHKIKFHPKESQLTINDNVSGEECSTNLSTEQNPASHSNKSEEAFQCKDCEMSFPLRSDFTEHIRSVHLNAN